MGITVWVVLAGLFAIGLSAGFLMHRSDFCMAGAFRDLFLFRSLERVRPLVLLIALSALLFEICRLAGLLPAYPFPFFAPPAGVSLLGGIIFGVGMVLAGGCVVGVLYKLGSGSLTALIALAGLLVGSALYAEMHDWWSAISRATRFPTEAVTLPQLLDISPIITVLFLLIMGGYCCRRWQRAGLWQSRNAADGFIPRWKTAVGLAVLGLMTVLLSGMPMGVTTSYIKGAALIESWLAPGHMASLAYFAAEPVRHALPIDGILRSGSAGPRFDILVIVQLPLILGIVGGAWWSAYRLGEFRPVWRVPFRQVVMVFTGGVIMGLGSRITPGCNIWHLWGGLPLLTMQSLLFAVGLLPGAWLGARILQGVLFAGQRNELVVSREAMES